MAPTLTFILFLSLVKVGYEDYLRHKADAKENGQKVEVFDVASGKFLVKEWKQCKIGDVLKLKNRDFNPCDIVLLASADTENNAVFINTKALDGETDLKIREVHKDMVRTSGPDDNLPPESIAKTIKSEFLRGENPSKIF